MSPDRSANSCDATSDDSDDDTDDGVCATAGGVCTLRAAIEQGMVGMFEYGIATALLGETSIEEIMRVTREAGQ